MCTEMVMLMQMRIFSLCSFGCDSTKNTEEMLSASNKFGNDEVSSIMEKKRQRGRVNEKRVHNERTNRTEKKRNEKRRKGKARISKEIIVME